ncbi:MAG TPA: response regulator [Verrucomicrobiae bacterium]|nr:response regulator [Verrucomicrobiae bacterium]
MTRSAAKEKNHRTAGPAVLLVDDNADDQLFFQLAWEKDLPNHPLRVVASRQEAMDYLNGRGHFADRTAFPIPSVIILDMRLPDGSGSELVRWIRGRTQFKRLTVIVMSGSAHEQDVHQAYANGANSFLLKSARPADLRQTVQLIQSYWLSQNLSPGTPLLQV